MRQTIQVEQVLRETVQTPYRDLVTRATGRAVRTSIEQALEAAGAMLTVLDFSEVGLVDFSCADEIVAKLLLNQTAGTFVLLQGLREDQLDAIEHVLDHHAIVALIRDRSSGTVRMVGRVEPDMRDAFGALETGEMLSTDGVAARTGWTFERARTALESLTRLNVVRASDGSYTVPLAV
ncbi:MAG: hypothetical protein ABI587_01450 [Gemmatimonadales bacterium]